MSERGFELSGPIESSISHGNIQLDSLLIFLALLHTAAYKSEIVTQLCILMIILGNDCQIHDLFVALVKQIIAVILVLGVRKSEKGWHSW